MKTKTLLMTLLMTMFLLTTRSFASEPTLVSQELFTGISGPVIYVANPGLCPESIDGIICKKNRMRPLPVDYKTGRAYPAAEYKTMLDSFNESQKKEFVESGSAARVIEQPLSEKDHSSLYTLIKTALVIATAPIAAPISMGVASATGGVVSQPKQTGRIRYSIEFADGREIIIALCAPEVMAAECRAQMLNFLVARQHKK